jgi:hypothetical protein
LSATSSLGFSFVGTAPTGATFFFAIARVLSIVVVSPWSAGWSAAATMTPVSRSTACSGL